MNNDAQITLPVLGMTCANCVAAVERNAKKVDGVANATVNYASEKVTLAYDAKTTDIQAVVDRIGRAGYSVPTATIEVPITGMTCTNCSNTVQRRLNKRVPGVLNATVNYATEKATIEYVVGAVTRADLYAAVREAGYDVVEITDGIESEDLEAEARAAEVKHQKQRLIVGAIFTIPLFLLSMSRDFGLVGHWAHATWVNWLFLVLATPVQFYVGWDYYVGAYKSLCNGSANMDVLVALGSSVAYVYSIAVLLAKSTGSNAWGDHGYFETSAMIITLIVLGKLLEARAKGQTSAAIKKLMGLRAKTARVIRQGEEIDLPIAEVVVGDHVIIRPGEKVPVDGLVVTGRSTIDESMITGESLPVAKTIGAEVIGATINKQGLLTIEATRVGRQTALAQIIRLVEQAQGSKAPIQKLVDRVAAYFVPIVIVLALLTFVVWWLSGAGLTPSLLRLTAVLVIACPCAMGLATPTSIMVGVGKGAEQGILFKNSDALERAHHVSAVIFDKTGTITNGEPVLTDIVVSSEARWAEPQLLGLAAAAEKGSEHPLGEAIVAAAKGQGVKMLESAGFQAIPGHGIRAQVAEHDVLLGNLRLMERENVALNGLGPKAHALQAEAKTAMWLSVDGQASALLAVADTVKEGSAEAITALHEQGIKVVMLTGDNEATAREIAAQVGIDEVRAEVLPGEKAGHVIRLQDAGEIVAMVGDGINDAPALAQADVGIAIGTGTDVAMETADITLMRGDLRSVSQALKLSGATMRNIRQNLGWAFGYNTVLIPVAAGVLALFAWAPPFLQELHPILAAGAMAFSSISVISNALRLKRVQL